MAQTMYTGTASQIASAELHLSRREEWRYVRIAGTRYVVLPSGRSASTYWVRDDAAGCSCLWYARTLTACSHMIAVRQANEVDATVPSLKSYRDLFPGCAGGCGDLVERQGERCYSCISESVGQR